MPLDAIIISGSEDLSYAKSNSMRLKIGADVATIQRIKALFKSNEDNTNPDVLNWHNAPKLNGISLYSYLLEIGLCSEIIDSFSREKDRFAELITHGPKFILISTTFITDKPSLKALVADVRKLTGNITIIAGGPFVFSSYLLYNRISDPDYDTDSAKSDFLFLEDTGAREPDVDYYIVGAQGLNTLSTLIRCLEENRSVNNIKNVVYQGPSGLVFNNVDLDPDYEPIQINWRSLPSYLFDNQVMNLQASNGCPFNCRFCNFVKSKNATFVRSIHDIIADMKVLQSRGIKYIRFVDDNFRLGKPDMELFCRELLDNNIRIKWMSFMRLSNLDGIDYQLLKKAGCIECQFGIESANQAVLEAMRKQSANPVRVGQVIKELLKTGINVSSCFVIGFPTETESSVQDTIDFINGINSEIYPGCFTWSLYPFYVLPLSPIYEKDERAVFGLEGYLGNWSHKTMDSTKAVKFVQRAFLSISTAGPMYTGDNIEMMLSISPEQRKAFHIKRHELSIKSLKHPLGPKDIAEAFRPIFSHVI